MSYSTSDGGNASSDQTNGRQEWPSAPESERYAVGYLMYWPEIAPAVLLDEMGLSHKHMRLVEHEAIMRSIEALHEAGEPPYFEAVVDQLRDMGKLEDARGASGVDSVQSAPSMRIIGAEAALPTMGHAEAMGRLVLKAAAQRDALSLNGKIAAAAYVGDFAALGELAARLTEIHATPDDDIPDLTLSQLRAIPRAEPLIPGMIAAGSHVVVYGSSDAGKSFWVQNEVAFSLAAQGHHVRYIAGEGSAGLALRADAWLLQHPDTDRSTFEAHLHITDRPVQMFADGGAQVARLCAQLKHAPYTTDLVVIDTVNVCTDGADENSNSDMRCVVAAATQVRLACGAAFLAIHHDGKTDGKGPRGAQNVHNNALTVIQIERPDDGTVSLVKCRKQQAPGWERFKTFGFTLVRQAVDEAGDLSEYVVRLVDAQEAAAARPSKVAPSWQPMCLALANLPDGLTADAWQKRATHEFGVARSTFYMHHLRIVAAGYASKAADRFTLTAKGAELIQVQVQTESKMGPTGPAPAARSKSPTSPKGFSPWTVGLGPDVLGPDVLTRPPTACADCESIGPFNPETGLCETCRLTVGRTASPPQVPDREPMLVLLKRQVESEHPDWDEGRVIKEALRRKLEGGAAS